MRTQADEVRRIVKRSILAAIPFAAIVGLSSIVNGAIKDFRAGEPLSSSKMNANFNELDARIKTLETAGPDTTFSPSVPTGTVVAFAAAKAPDGWVPCDGASLSGNDPKYKELYKVIGITHGGNAAQMTFNVPDYRGRFLRGASLGSTRDPDAASRTAMNAGGVTGDVVGSVQAGQFASHNHGGGNHSHTFSLRIARAGAGFVTGGTWPPYEDSPNPNVQGISASGTIVQTNGGAETRPVNAAVSFIIKL